MDSMYLHKKLFGYQRTFLLLLGLSLILGTISPDANAQDDDFNTDKLAYVSNEGHLMLYDPSTHIETLLIEDVSGFIIGESGRVAFSRQNNNKLDIYVFDSSTLDLISISITNDPSLYVNPLAWSQDGHYLALGAYQDRNDQSIYVWDGETTINIMPETPLGPATGFQVDWSDDRRLAFQIAHYNWSNGGLPPEIYIWDGSTSVNLSQNTEGWDSAARWSSTGQLMFGLNFPPSSGVKSCPLQSMTKGKRNEIKTGI